MYFLRGKRPCFIYFMQDIRNDNDDDDKDDHNDV